MSQLDQEIAEIPARLKTVAAANRKALADAAARFKAKRPPALFTIARGTSDAVATYAGYRLTPALNLPVGSFAPSLASLDGARPQGGGVWTLSISQSARSPDLIAAQAAFADAGGVRLALVNDVTAPLATGADIILDQSAGAEKSVAATKSFACSLLAVDLLAEVLAGRGDGAEARCVALAEAAQKQMEAKLDLGLLESVEAAYVIGRGLTLPIATEAALKLKETSGLHAEAVSAAEVMHGPRAIAGKSLAVLGFAGPGAAGASVADALRQLSAQGSPTLLISAPALSDALAPASPVPMIAGFYASLPALARRRGRDPERPPSLSKVTLTN